MKHIVRDIRILADSINRQWKSNRATWGVWSDAQHMTDPAALHRVINWMMRQPPAVAVRGYRAAMRLRAALSNVTAGQQAEIHRQLRLAELIVVRTLRQLPSGRWVRLPCVEAYA